MALYFGKGKLFDGEAYIAEVDYTLEMSASDSGIIGNGEIRPIEISEFPTEFKDAFLQLRSGNKYPIFIEVWDAGGIPTWEFEIRQI